MTEIILGIFSIIIILVYIVAILIFTPDEKDDKYIIALLKFGFKSYDLPDTYPITIRYISKKIGKILMIIVYEILENRKYIQK